MTYVIVFYIINATLLLLHEIESAFEKEWEILRLPGKITGFLLLHIPIILLFFIGLIELYEQTTIGMIIGIVTGVGGYIPFLVHKIFVKREDRFNRPISKAIMILGVVAGSGTVFFSIISLF